MPLPVDDRLHGDPDFVGNFLLEEPPQDALPAEVLPPAPGFLRKGRILGFPST
jgi:hypothetical protein